MTPFIPLGLELGLAQAEPGELQQPRSIRAQHFLCSLSTLGSFFSLSEVPLFFFSSPLISLSIKSLPRANVINLDPKPDA